MSAESIILRAQRLFSRTSRFVASTSIMRTFSSTLDQVGVTSSSKCFRLFVNTATIPLGPL